MRVTAQVQVNLRAKEVKAAGPAFAREFARQMGERTVKYAKENVAQGFGPGPHPHRSEHEDTGALAESVKMELVNQGFLIVAKVYTDLAYGKHLELGWHTKNGNFYRYPWLAPAGERARQDAIEIARLTWRIVQSGAGGFYTQRQAASGAVFGTP